jgi:hypothetical protein
MPKPNDKHTKTNAMRGLDQHCILYEALPGARVID